MNTGAAAVSGTGASATATPIGTGNPALKDVRVRQAIDYAVDRKTLVNKVLGGYGQEGSTIIPDIYANEHLTPADQRNFDLDKANSILDAAGYTKGSDGIRIDPYNGNKPLSLRLYGRDDSPTSQQAVQYIQGWLQADRHRRPGVDQVGEQPHRHHRPG